MPDRDPVFSAEDVAAQDRHRPDQQVDRTPPPNPAEPADQAEAEPGKKPKKRETQDQINVLITKGLAKPFKLKAWSEDTTMSDLIDQWVKEYLAGKR